MDIDELRIYFETLGQPSFRAEQVFRWFSRGASYSEMTNIPGSLRSELEEIAPEEKADIERVFVSVDGLTEKYLYKLNDGERVEGVLMRHDYGYTLCCSTQAGCRMGCVFCASTEGGLIRNLTPGEMLFQVTSANKRISERGKIKNVVLMGSGEPLDNYENVVKFLRIASSEKGLHLSLRGVSLPTCGLPEQMRRLADEKLPITLCVSLHASNDIVRRKLMPTANAHNIDAIIAASRYYVERTGRRVIIEYVLVDGVNCEPAHADELAKLLRGFQCHVNLIPLNPTNRVELRPPNARVIKVFIDRLASRHISATLRRGMGADIEGACGQLRANWRETV
jgi:23S rRNA (adenine2503-C2)-methyltransferase